jgi:hypothetical protein
MLGHSTSSVAVALNRRQPDARANFVEDQLASGIELPLALAVMRMGSPGLFSGTEFISP